MWNLWWPPLCYISYCGHAIPNGLKRQCWAISQQTVHHLGFINSPLKATFGLPPVFNPTCCTPAFASPETEKDSKCKLSPLGWEQPTDSSQPLWRTQGCLCKCQSHAAHSAILHMLRSACCASTAWWKTQKKKIRCAAKWQKQSNQSPFLLPQVAIVTVTSSCLVWLFTVIIAIIVVLVFVLWPSQIDSANFLLIIAKGKEHIMVYLIRLSQCSLCQSNVGLGLRLGTHQLWTHGGR